MLHISVRQAHVRARPRHVPRLQRLVDAAAGIVTEIVLAVCADKRASAGAYALAVLRQIAGKLGRGHDALLGHSAASTSSLERAMMYLCPSFSTFS